MRLKLLLLLNFRKDILKLTNKFRENFLIVHFGLQKVFVLTLLIVSRIICIKSAILNENNHQFITFRNKLFSVL